MPRWYPLMVRAKRDDISFWPAPSILDVPTLIFAWQEIAAAAEAKAKPRPRTT